MLILICAVIIRQQPYSCNTAVYSRLYVKIRLYPVYPYDILGNENVLWIFKTCILPMNDLSFCKYELSYNIIILHIPNTN